MLDFIDKQGRLRGIVFMLAILAAMLIVGGAGGMAWMMYFDTAPPFVSNEVCTMDASGRRTDTFRPGDTMLVHRDLCFLRDTPVTFGRQLERIAPSPLNVSINTTSGMLRKGCVKNENVLRIPESTPPGTYLFQDVIQWSNNPFHEGAVALPAPTIEIIR